MSFRPESLRGIERAASPGDIDYRLARNVVITEFKKGRLSKLEVCDAHPELLRAARNVGEPTRIDCPICEESQVVLVSYGFGGRLPPGGVCVTNKKELKDVARKAGQLTCYVVEVCPQCAWNHLAQTLIVEHRGAR